MTLRCPIPEGGLLEGSQRSFDASEMRSLIEVMLDPETRLVSLEPYYVRYKGLDGCLVGWRVELDGVAGARTSSITARSAEPKRLEEESEKLSYRSGEYWLGIESFRLFAEEGLLLVAFPVDRQLGDLRRMHRVSKVRNVLQVEAPDFIGPDRSLAKPECVMQLLRYKPERRAVLSWDLALKRKHDAPREVQNENPRVFVRVYDRVPSQDPFRALRAAQQAGLSVPTTLARAKGTLVIETCVPGVPLDPGSDSEVERAGRCLALLHALRPGDVEGRRDDERELAVAWRSVQDLTQIDRDSAREAARILEALEKQDLPAARRVLLHGDFHPGQVLIAENDAGLVDFDRASLGVAEIDLANYFVHVARTPLATSYDSLLRCYEAHAQELDRARLAWHECCALVRYAMTPFRTMRPDWPGELRHILALAADRVSPRP